MRSLRFQSVRKEKFELTKEINLGHLSEIVSFKGIGFWLLKLLAEIVYFVLY